MDSGSKEGRDLFEGLSSLMGIPNSKFQVEDEGMHALTLFLFLFSFFNSVYVDIFLSIIGFISHVYYVYICKERERHTHTVCVFSQLY